MHVATTIAEDVKAGQAEHVFAAVRPYYEDPLVVVEGSGMTVVDADGREYLDFFAGILTTSLGHCHPEVVQRVREQVGRLGHTSTLYLNENQVRVARRLAELGPGELRKSFFVNSGTEAIETAIMLACIHTGRSEVIALRHAYSGRSILATNITGHAAWRPLASSIAGIKHAVCPYPYRSPFGDLPEEEAAEAFARDIEDVIATTTTGRPAAFIAEPILGVGGFIVPPRGYYRRAAEIIRAAGGLFIADEVQTGFGRTGGKWWGIEHSGVTPDIMVMAKGIANGFPVGATLTTDEIAASWTGATISTFGGNPVSMAAADATLEVMVREDTPSRSAARGARLRSGLDALYDRHEWIGEVRGLGLMQALEIVEDRDSRVPDSRRARALLEAAREEGLLIGLGGLKGQVVRMGPSMLVTEAEVDDALDRLGRACRRADGSG
ncbi:MAG: aspartate aminotransferase family protein [Gemmatimonadetes bacterium]|nr:aspartate aminotransferase family protein [Gemmatimonadota bacterium]